MREEPGPDVMFLQHWDMGNPGHLWRRGLEGQLEHSLEAGQFPIVQELIEFSKELILLLTVLVVTPSPSLFNLQWSNGIARQHSLNPDRKDVDQGCFGILLLPPR